MMSKPKIFPASNPGGYYINHKFVYACNWFISKEKFTIEEQKEFEKYMKKSNILLVTPKIRDEVIFLFTKTKNNSISNLAQQTGLTKNQTNAIISKYLKTLQK